MFVFNFYYMDRNMSMVERRVVCTDPKEYVLPYLRTATSEWICPVGPPSGPLSIDSWSVLLYAMGTYGSRVALSDNMQLNLYERERVEKKKEPRCAGFYCMTRSWVDTAIVKLEPAVQRVKSYNSTELGLLSFLLTWAIIGVCKIPIKSETDKFVCAMCLAVSLFVAVMIAAGPTLEKHDKISTIMKLGVGTEEKVTEACERHDYNVKAVVKELLKE
jgi:hypothetical protein